MARLKKIYFQDMLPLKRMIREYVPGLPEDFRIVGIEYSHDKIDFHLQSDEFQDLPEGMDAEIVVLPLDGKGGAKSMNAYFGPHE